MNYFIILFLAFIWVLILNIALRQQVFSYIFKDKYITNKWLLCLLIIPTKKKILLAGFLNYIIQFILFLVLLILFSFDWVNHNNFFVNNVFVYIFYLIFSIIPLLFSGLGNRWNHK